MSMLLLDRTLTNASLAILMTIVAIFISRWVRNSRIDAILCMAILIKLVAPPLVPITIVSDRFRTEPVVKTNVESTSQPSPAPVVRPDDADQIHVEQTSEPRSINPAIPASVPQPLISPNVKTSSLPDLRQISWLCSINTWIYVWLTVALMYMAIFVVNAYRFQRFLTRIPMHECPAALQTIFEHHRQTMLRGQRPDLRMIDGRFSPMTWVWAGKTTILCPRQLFEQLTPQQQSMVIVHELAHVQRHDHLFRWIETLVQSIYWWFPLVPWVRRRLHAAQEFCCDAEVLRQFSDHQQEYSEALYITASWLLQSKRSPSLAVEFGQNKTLKSRIQNLLQPTISDRLSGSSRALCLLGVAVSLALTIQFVKADNPKPEPQLKSEKETSSLQLFIRDYAGKAIQTGTVEVTGKNHRDEYFQKNADIKDGAVSITLDSYHVNEVRFKIESPPTYMTYYHEFTRGDKEAFLTLNPQYTFRLRVGMTIGGKVVDQEGQPVANARVYAYTQPKTLIKDGMDVFERRTTTNEKGEWSLSGADHDLPHLTLSIAESHDAEPGKLQAVFPEQFAALKNQTDVRTIEVAPKSTGLVVDNSGKPISGAMILIHERNLFVDYGNKMIPTTNEKGEFPLAGLAGKSLSLTVFSPDWALQTVKVDFPLTSPVKVVMRKGKRVAFRAVDEAGQPIAGVSFYPEGTDKTPFNGTEKLNYFPVLDFLGHRNLIHNTTDANGDFIWVNAPDEKLAYQIVSPNVLSQPGGEYGPTDAPHVIVFRRTIPLRLNIVDDVTSEEIADYRIFQGIHFKANPPEIWSWSPERRSNEFKPGRYETVLRTLDRLVRYRIQADGYQFALTEIYDAKQLPNDPIVVTIRLKKAKKLTYTIRSNSGQVASGAMIATKVKRERDLGLTLIKGQVKYATATALTTSDESGRFQLELPNEPFTWFITHKTGFTELTDVELDQSPEVSLIPWSNVTGRFQIRQNPAKNLTVRLEEEDGFRDESIYPRILKGYEDTTDVDGRFHFENVSAGTWNIMITYDPTLINFHTAYHRKLKVQVPAGETVNSSLDEFRVSAVGRFLFPEGKEIDKSRSHIYLKLQDESKEKKGILEDRHFMAIPADGRFEFHQLLPSAYDLTVYLQFTDQSHLWFETTPITPEMFPGESSQPLIELGEIRVINKTR